MGRATNVTAAARRQKAAASLVAATPATPAELAAQLGVTPGHASNLMRDPETRAIARGLLEPHRQRISALIPKALDRIEDGLDATHCGVPDILMRLRSVDRLRKLVELLDFSEANDGRVPPPDGLFRGTLEDLLVSYRRVTVETAPH